MPEPDQTPGGHHILTDREKLLRVLDLEAELGYRNIAVIGGLEKFLDNFFSRETRQCQTNEERKFLELIGLGAKQYASMTLIRRKAWHRNILKYLKPESKSMAPSPESLSAAKKPARKPKNNGRVHSDVTLESPVTALKGISSSMATKLARLGVASIRDMLYFFPHRHLDYSLLKTVSDLQEGPEESILANIWEVREVRLKSRRSTEAVLGDRTGNIRAVWFNNPYLVKQLPVGKQMVVSGRVRFFNDRPVFESPDWEIYEPDEELVHTGRLVPVYSLTRGLYQRQLRKIVKAAVDMYSDTLPEYIPQQILEKYCMPGLSSAIRQAHFPDNSQLKNQARTRLAFNELILMQLGVLRQKRRWQTHKTRPIETSRQILDSFTGKLPFDLTGSQKRVISEVLGDLQHEQPMVRLLQGEVGSGKTVVALSAMLMAVAAGRQCAFMAPTEILAQQHFQALDQLLSRVSEKRELNPYCRQYDFSPDTIPTTALLTSDIKKVHKTDINHGVRCGDINILVGTHAIIQQEVLFKDLGLVVIDEQHRFGVVQRQSLRQKGQNPHVLVMTATPIPRTLALTLYGDLDLSVIDELPPGRQTIKTRWLLPPERYKAYNFLRKEIARGRQAFIICPLVEESDVLQVKAAIHEYENLSAQVFPDLRLGLVHGRLKQADKENVMRRFYAGELDILVATPVVEVGIDVPNASVILIEDANRFGLSQLHQFRGRVGRGEHQSYCILVSAASGSAGAERLKAIEEIHDGFKLAEKDLSMRGPGEFFGTRQSGLPDLKMARISDVALLEKARSEANCVFQKDPELVMPEHRGLNMELARIWPLEGSERS